jgi:hypothetical protein
MINVFGGSAVQPGDVAFRAVTLDADVTLVWPAQSQTANDHTARTMDVTASGSYIMGLPDATLVGNGYDLLIANRGATTFTVSDNSGGVIATVAAGQQKYLYLTDNSTVAGTWSTVLFGAVSSTLDAGALAGLGLTAIGATIAAAPVTATFGSNYSVVAADRAKVFVWTGGVGTVTLPVAASAGVGNNFFFGLRNAGTGILTVAISGADTIDGAASIALQPTESTYIHTNGATVWGSVGRGRSTQFNFTLLVKGITGGTVTLTPTEAANVVQRYTGVLVSNCDVELPSVVQVYYVSNQTSGAFSVTFKTAGVGTTVIVPTGSNAVLFCDGVNVLNTTTTVSGITSLTLDPGAVATPSLNYLGDLSTGMYQPVGGSIAFTSAGVNVGTFSAVGLTLPGALAVTGAGVFGANVSATTAPTIGDHLTNKTYVDGLVAGGGFLPLTGGAGSPMTGTIYGATTLSEMMRIRNDNGFISFYNTAAATRIGYIQGSVAGSILGIVADTGFGAAIYTNAALRMTVNVSGEFGINATPVAGIPIRIAQAGTTDVGLEWQRVSATSGILISYDRTAVADRSLGYRALDHTWYLAGGAGAWTINSSGHYTPITTAVYNIGSAALRPAVVYGVAGNFSGTLAVTNIGGTADSTAWSIWGGLNVLDGGYMQFYGSTHATTPNTVLIGSEGSGTRLFVDAAGTTFSGGKVKVTVTGITTLGDVSTTYSMLSADRLFFVDSSRSANNRNMEQYFSGGTYGIRFVNDAYSLAATGMIMSGGQAAGISNVIFYTGATVETLRLAGGTGHFNTTLGTTATYQLQVSGAGQLGTMTDAGAKGATLALNDTAAGGAGQGGAITFHGFGILTPMAGIKSYITDAANNSRGDIWFCTRAVATDTQLTVVLKVTANQTITDANNNELGFKGLPTASVTTGAFVAADRGKIVKATAGVTVPNATMTGGDVVVIYNTTAGAITITATITTLRLAGTATVGNRTLASRGIATIYFDSGTDAVISGTGLS